MNEREEPSMSKITITVGALIRGQVRRELEKAVFYGHLGSFKELKGFLDSDFLLTNPSLSVLEWIKEVGEGE